MKCGISGSLAYREYSHIFKFSGAMAVPLLENRSCVRAFTDPFDGDEKAWKFAYLQSKLLHPGLSRPDPFEVYEC